MAAFSVVSSPNGDTTCSATGNPLDPVRAWFATQGWVPFAFQEEAWAAYARGEGGLIHAPTGMGKTYAAALGPMVFSAPAATADVPRPLTLLWITPLRALAADTGLAISRAAAALQPNWTVDVRTGDSSASARARQSERLPSVLVTTPESLTLLLSRAGWRQRFACLDAVVVDEWHELLSTKRGVQVELALARLRKARPALRTWGLSATIANLDVALQCLAGTSASRTSIVKGFDTKQIVIATLRPKTIERFPWAGHIGLKLLPEVVRAIERAKSTLVFTNVRSQCEAWYRAILDARPDWAGTIALHHGSLERDVRDWVEDGLRNERLRAVVCTSSLDLGVDFAPVEQVLQIGSPKGVARLLQRAGRSGHRPGAISRVSVVPAQAIELVEAAAAREAAAVRDLEARDPLERPLDVLVQHLVTCALGDGFRPADLLDEVRTTHAYASLTDEQWQFALDFVIHGGASLNAYPEYRRVVMDADGVARVPDAHIARRHRLSIGTILSDNSIVVQFQNGTRLGHVEEDFIARLAPGDCFVFAGRVLEFIRVRELTAWVRLASGKSGVVPRWMGGKMALSSQLATGTRKLIAQARRGRFESPEMQLVQPLLELQARWSALPLEDEWLVEQIATREGYGLFFYAFEGRLAHLGLATLFSYRLSRDTPRTFSITANDYGFGLVSPTPVTLHIADVGKMLAAPDVDADILAGLNATELGRRQFREIARVAGLIFQGYPGQPHPQRQLQASSSLLYDVFAQYDPGNPLLEQAMREVLDRRLEASRLHSALARLRRSRIVITRPRRPTPFAFPLLVEIFRDKLSTEALEARVARMVSELENAAR